MAHGRVAECAPPVELLERPGSLFASLVGELGEEGQAEVRGLVQ